MKATQATTLYISEPFPPADKVTLISGELALLYGSDYYYVKEVHEGFVWWRRLVGYELSAIEGKDASANFLGHISGHPSARTYIGRFDTAKEVARCIQQRILNKKP